MNSITSQSRTRADKEKVSNNDLSKIVRQWEQEIRNELHWFARKQWPMARLLGLFPLRSYRFRKQFEPGIYIWWVEHDIPPYDRYRCVAYRAELSLTRSGQPQLLLRSGTATYPVVPVSIEGLEGAFFRMKEDPPLIIRRQFGQALDP